MFTPKNESEYRKEVVIEKKFLHLFSMLTELEFKATRQN
ncbi:hypothetical protein VAA_03610 [Vibrio anguillarum 775]|nr:hypothetical protein VAA_03610 [Vibrio anguillarum 775]ARV27709.1 hypothetical protein A6A12_2053 [Vibrio anguillarum]